MSELLDRGSSRAYYFGRRTAEKQLFIRLKVSSTQLANLPHTKKGTAMRFKTLGNRKRPAVLFFFLAMLDMCVVFERGHK